MNPLPPFQRFRPLRETAADRLKNAEFGLARSQIIVPLFVVEGRGVRREITSLKDVYHLSIDQLVIEAQRLLSRGFDKVLLFGVPDPDQRDSRGSSAYQGDPLVSRAIRALKAALPALTVLTDVCLCAYTDHGHCGLVQNQTIDNDATLPLLGAMAASHAAAGADWVAPSAMMDGQVAAIRSAVDAQGLKTPVLSYSSKFASALYGPFREAAGSAPSFGDRKSYQMDWRTRTQPLAEVQADLDEGAAAVMVKPALAYLDIIQRVRQAHPGTLLAAYHVSGEYMMVRSAGAAGLLDERRVMTEHLHALRRAGTDWIITYAAEQVDYTEGENL